MACIITPRIRTPISTTRESTAPPANSDTSDYIAGKQQAKMFLYDWIHGNARPRDLLNVPEIWKGLVQENNKGNLDFAISCLAKIEDVAAYDKEASKPTELPQVFISLPAEAELLGIILAFYHSTLPLFPLFQEEIKKWLKEKTYLDPRLHEDIPTWASLNVVLSLGCQYHLLRHPDPAGDMVKYKGYLKNALDTIPSLILGPPTIAGVEALLGIVALIGSTLDVPPTYSLLAVAISKARSLRMDRVDGLLQQGKAAQEINTQRYARVFWELLQSRPATP
ncbi:hypothetical protein BJY01DRAFT_245331 [Aspergillus pseudoustus]|uniref:Uncharacterized protein n=1 Tax=Aspergillus pseudoustus TaxID=1810923 RepID=A0ABR4KEE4_9EURO